VTTKPEPPSSKEPAQSAEAARAPMQTSVPDIKVDYKPAGRETLDAITAELVPLPANWERESSSPEIIVREGVIERDTLAAIMEEANAGQPAAEPSDDDMAVTVAKLPVPARAASKPAATPAATIQGLEIFEMVTYVVRGGDVARLASESLRRQFVEEHLLGRLPVKSMADVDRVDVTPWTVQGTLVVRVWCRTGP